MSNVDDEADIETIRLAAKGDPLAQERFLLQHRPILLRYLKRRIPEDLRPHIDAEDVFQDICFDVFRRMSTFSATDSHMAIRWLLRIAHNRIVDLVRMHLTSKRGGGRVGNTAIDEPEDSVIKLLHDLSVYSRTPSRSAISHELLATLERSLDRLPADLSQAVRYRYIDGLRFHDAGVKMNRSDEAVQKLCKRGLDALRLELRSFSRYI